jgi:hypothetical protein
MIVLGFIGSGDMVGVTSFCRFWGTGDLMYHKFRHFFRSKAWSLSNLISHWAAFVLKQGEAVVANGRVVLLGDHTHVPKDGRQMPGVVSLHQQSETQTKPSYFRGHCWGAIGVVIGTMALPFCLPLDLAIHLGLLHRGQKQRSEDNPETMGTRIVQMAIDFAYKNNVLSVLVLDAFFPSKVIFKLAAATWSLDFKQPFVTLIVRAKKTALPIFKLKKNRIEVLENPQNMEKRSSSWSFLTILRIFGRSPATSTAKQRRSCFHLSIYSGSQLGV